MRDIILQCAGVAGIAVALIHGVLGETKVFARATIQPESLRTLIRLVWQAGTVAWIGGAVLLIAAPSMGSESARHWIVVTIVAIYGFAAAANAWWSTGPRVRLEGARCGRRAGGRGVLEKSKLVGNVSA